jgi:uncharacterized protein (DUF427 family)
MGGGIRVERVEAHAVVELDGTVLAESRRPLLLHERGLPPRVYLDRDDVRIDLLSPSQTTSYCPFKGTASYWSAAGAADAFWCYEDPLPERRDIAGLLAPWPGRVRVTLDGQPL